jgi:hypothetical protein
LTHSSGKKLRVYTYYSQQKLDKYLDLSLFDIVLTTYGTVSFEYISTKPEGEKLLF